MNTMETSLESTAALRQILTWGVTLLTPVFLVLAAVRLLLTPLYVPLEYRMPGFPPDPFGFTQEERLHWSRYAVEYLVNQEGIEYLGSLRFDDGQPVYNERELQHMVDVKNVVQGALKVWFGSIGLLALLAGAAWLTHNGDAYLRGLARGGWLTVLLLGSVLLLVLLAFGVLFVTFHNVFFAPGTWTFLYSDTLIRLFPERFWRDTFIAVGALAGGAGLLLGFIFRKV